MIRHMVVLAAGLAAASIMPTAQAQSAAHVVVVSIDGLRPEVYRTPEKEGVAMPNLVALARRGVQAERTLSVYPSVTYPAHTTMVTGVEPARHKVTSNFRFGTLEWLTDAADIRSPTLWQAARKAGVSTAAFMWPMTHGADIDWMIPEVEDTRKEGLRAALTRGATKGLVADLERKVAPLPDDSPTNPRAVEDLDRAAARYAAHVITAHKPGLTLVHFLEADHMQHAYGPQSDQARRAFEHIDSYLAVLTDALKAAGIADTTDVIVVGDHGFAPVHTVVNVSRILLDSGAGELAGPMVRSDLVTFESQAGSGLFYPLAGADPAKLAAFQGRLEQVVTQNYRGILTLMSAEDVTRMGGAEGAIAGLDAASGYMVAGGPGSERMLPTTQFGGMHGYAPDMPEMATGLVAAGPSFHSGKVLPVARLLDLAPTVAQILKLPLEHADGSVMVGAMKVPAGARSVF